MMIPQWSPFSESTDAPFDPTVPPDEQTLHFVPACFTDGCPNEAGLHTFLCAECAEKLDDREEKRALLHVKECAARTVKMYAALFGLCALLTCVESEPFVLALLLSPFALLYAVAHHVERALHLRSQTLMQSFPYRAVNSKQPRS